MKEETTGQDWSKWFSTYGLLTAKRVLDGFQIHLNQEELTAAIKNSRSIYYQLLRIPLKNIFNGIIFQQARDYQIYAQKLFVDYLLSGENDKPAESPGAETRTDLENERTDFVNLGVEFDSSERDHLVLIAESQAHLIELAQELEGSLKKASVEAKQILQSHQLSQKEEAIKSAIRNALIDCELIGDDILGEDSSFWLSFEKRLAIEPSQELRIALREPLALFTQHRVKISQSLSEFLERADDMGIRLREYRSQFYQVILRTTERMQLLADYHPDAERTAENLSALDFDPKIGESSAL